MPYEIDHLFVCTSVGAPEADLLANFGLTEGSANRHHGQGTENRRFFFHNSMLELLWVSDPAEARSDATQRTLLWDRWMGRNESSSPFGVCLRPSSFGEDKPPFSAWEYRPPYLATDLMIHVGEDARLNEPMWFFVAFGRRPDVVVPASREPLEHRVGFRETTGVHFVIPDLDDLSPAALAAMEASLVTMTAGQEHLLELTFDGNKRGRLQDFRPDLPLVVRW